MFGFGVPHLVSKQLVRYINKVSKVTFVQTGVDGKLYLSAIFSG